MGCTNSKVQVAPQKVTKGLVSGDEGRDTRPTSSESIRSPNEAKATSSSSTVNAKSIRNVWQAKNRTEASNSSETYGPNVVMVQEAKLRAEDNARSSSLASNHGCKVSVLTSLRNSSASSNGSGMSSDSGLGEEYAHVITEKSDTKSQENAKVPNNLDVPNFEITGVQLAVPEPLDHRMKTHARQQANQQCKTRVKQPLPPWSLQKRVNYSGEVETSDPSGMVQCSSSGRGISFEVQVGTRGLEGGGKRKKKPGAVRRLERRQKDVATKKELEEKQIAAEQRRKELEQKLLERLKAQQEKEREIKESLSKFIAMTVEKTGKKEATLENREAHIKELQDPLKKKHVEEVKTARRNANPSPIKQQTFSHEDNAPVCETN